MGFCMPSKGLIYVAFGKRYERLAARAITYSRTKTDLPILVLTDIPKNDRSPDWGEGIAFKDMSGLNIKNRRVKLSLNKYTPFDETLYLDCDSVIQNPGIERVFDDIVKHDIVLRVYGCYTKRTHLMSYYALTFDRCKVQLPVWIYYGAFVGFKKSAGTDLFFKTWYDNHETAGITREMPALAVTVKQLRDKINIHEYMTADNVFTWKRDSKPIIAHEIGDSATWWNNFWKRNSVTWKSTVCI